MLRFGRAVHRRLGGYDDAAFAHEPCPACGMNEGVRMRGVVWPELAFEWNLSPAWANWMDQREGLRCVHCGSNLRSRQLAKCLIDIFNNRLDLHANCLQELCQSRAMQALVVAEINAAGNLHPFLSQLPLLRYSEYGSLDHDVPSEDLMNLSYSVDTFDLIVNSDVLEHVPDPRRALQEIHRVLKRDGLFVLTVPVVWSQQHTRCRALINEGKLVHLLPPSHHGSKEAAAEDFLVFNEFGNDFIDLCREAGFLVEKVEDPRNPSLVTLIARKRNQSA